MKFTYAILPSACASNYLSAIYHCELLVNCKFFHLNVVNCLFVSLPRVQCVAMFNENTRLQRYQQGFSFLRSIFSRIYHVLFSHEMRRNKQKTL